MSALRPGSSGATGTSRTSRTLGGSSVASAAPRLVELTQVLHLTGRGRGVETADLGPRYQQREFLVEEMPDVLAAAAVVVSRAGMGTLSEIAALGKASLVVPIPASHQEPNARAFARGGGALVFQQESLSPELLVSTIRDLLDDPARREALGAAIRRVMPLDAAARIAEDVAVLARTRLPTGP